MKRERRSKIVFGDAGCTFEELRTALNAIEADLGKDAQVRFHEVHDRVIPDDRLYNIAAIAGYIEEED